MDFEKDEYIKMLYDESVSSLEKSRAVEFLSVLDTEDAKQHICHFLESNDDLLRESAIISSISHMDIDIYKCMKKIIESKDILDSSKQACNDIIESWIVSFPDIIKKFDLDV